MGRIPSAGVAVHGASLHTDVTRELFLYMSPYTGAGGDFHTTAVFSAYRMETDANGGCYTKIAKVPDKFVSFTKAEVIWFGTADSEGQDWHLRTRGGYAAAGEDKDTHVEAPSDQLIDVATIEEIYATDTNLTFADLASGDFFAIHIGRRGAEVDDTYGGQIWVLGVLFTYIAEQ